LVKFQDGDRKAIQITTEFTVVPPDKVFRERERLEIEEPGGSIVETH
jgi:hypothetical protein